MHLAQRKFSTSYVADVGGRLRGLDYFFPNLGNRLTSETPPHWPFQGQISAPKPRNDVPIEYLWKVQNELSSQWIAVNNLQRLYGKVANAIKTQQLPAVARLQGLQVKLAERVAKEELKLHNTTQRLQDLYDWSHSEDRGSFKTQIHVDKLILELEYELEK